MHTTFALPFVTHSVTHHQEEHSFFLFLFDSKTFETSSSILTLTEVVKYIFKWIQNMELSGQWVVLIQIA